MIFTDSNKAEAYTVHGVVFRSFMRSSNGARELGAWQADFPPHTPGVPHHMSVEEVLRVLSGRLNVEIGDQSAVLTSGDAITIPAGTRFRVSNESDELASAWVVTPLGMQFTLEGSTAPVGPPWAQ